MVDWPSDTEFVRMFTTVGASKMAEELGVIERAVYRQRRLIEKKTGTDITAPSRAAPERSARIEIDLPKNARVLIGSDAHYWPGEPSTAHLAFVKFIAEQEPKVVIMNGDAVDGASISRHPPIGWEGSPNLAEEIEVVQERLGDIEIETKKGVRRIWTLGNHDARFETKLASVAPEYREIVGVHLKDHFPHWEPCWSVFLNDDVVVKHRFKGGMHAPQNNTLWSGRTMVTGHLHSQKVMPITDYNGTRWGVDTGCMADPLGPQFVGYTEDSPLNWRQGFCLLTWECGRLLTPELIHVVEPGRYEFRGKTYGV